MSDGALSEKIKRSCSESWQQTDLDTRTAASSSELSSMSNISSFCPLLDIAAAVVAAGALAALALPVGTDIGGVNSSRRGSPLCFFLRLFFFLVATVAGAGGSGGSSGSTGSSSRAFAALCSTSDIQNRWLSVGIGEVARWAGTICWKISRASRVKRMRQNNAEEVTRD